MTELCEYCNQREVTETIIELWNGWIRKLCQQCTDELDQKYRVICDKDGKYMRYTDEQNEKWGVPLFYNDWDKLEGYPNE